MLKLFGFRPRGQAKTPKPTTYNERKTSLGKLRKLRHPNTTVDIADRSTSIKGEGKVVPEGEDSREYDQTQPAEIVLPNSQETEGPPNINHADTAHTFLPHTRAYDTNHPSSSISEDSSRHFSEGSEKPKVQTPASVAPTKLWSSIPSARRDSWGGGAGNSPHEWVDDRGAVQYWAGGLNRGPHDIPKRYGRRFITANPHQQDAQEHHDAENEKKASQQPNNYQPIISQANPREENENSARRANVSKQDHRGTSKAAVLGHTDRVEDSFEPEIYYYIVPAGLDIIFQDENGTEITRVGRTIKGTQDHSSQVHSKLKNIPIVVQDVLGNELFQSGKFVAVDHPSLLPQRVINRGQGFLHDPNIGMMDAMAGDDFVGRFPSRTSWKVILVDEKGNQIPLKYPERDTDTLLFNCMVEA
ncbi:hypothetical protein BYT27DRAFT_6416282 [Phlegmacium glaucopus]|nr:hypothetical protein BYT27DRAFT_6416282 [Phlegmacium glaucopus]